MKLVTLFTSCVHVIDWIDKSAWSCAFVTRRTFLHLANRTGNRSSVGDY